MFFYLCYVMVMVMLSLLLVTVAFLLSPKLAWGRESPSPFECGFDPKSSGRVPFSLRFYLIGMIFLVFDVEIAYLLPMIPGWSLSSTHLTLGGLVFISVLLLGAIYEWKEGSLDWES
uniref:NADH-ubiquinone oxidoreductase chain 3 n=1 Tax=Gyge ovalis TaxID=2008693 RepID=A0A343DSD2_9CRUS|nr:NADH dehydrogenase subunit 3 [Gyge ovalis]ASC43039.1 NADH dehydrogenase subunit 3 [Gyge ovalis]